MTEHEFYMQLGETYRNLRENHGIKGVDAAQKAGIASGDLSNFERKGKKLSAFRLKKLFEQVGIEAFSEKKA